jgi:hypothetical protein
MSKVPDHKAQLAQLAHKAQLADQLAPQGLQAQQETLVQPVQQAHKVLQELPDLKELLVRQVQPDKSVRRDLKGSRESRVFKVSREFKVFKVFRERPEMQVQPVQQATLDQSVLLVRKEIRDQLELRELPVQLVHKDRKVVLEQRVQLEQLDLPVLKGFKAKLV